MANGVINVLFNVSEHSNGTIVRSFGRSYLSVTCIATADQLLAAWATLDRGDTVDTIIGVMGRYFSFVRVPSVNPGGTGIAINPEGKYYSEVVGFAGGTVLSGTFASGDAMAIVDDSGNGFYATRGSSGCQFHIDGTVYQTGGASGIISGPQFGISSIYSNPEGYMEYYTNLVIPFRTTDNRIGTLTCTWNKNNSSLWITNAAESAIICDFLDGVTPPSSDTPYAGEPSGPGGGLGPHEMHYDSISFPELPALSAVNTGFASIWVPELREVQALATYMWNCDPTTLDFWKRLAADPLDLILGFYIFPVQLTPDGAENVTIGIINTGVSMHYRNSQYVDVDCGTVQLDEYWKAYLDYSPYTRLSIYLPYIGVRPLDIDDVMGRSITLRYRIDLASGACVAMLRVDGSETEQDREAVLYQFTGFCATQIPVTSVQMGDLVRSTVSLVASIAGAVTGGASLGDVASSAANLATTKPDIAHSGAIGSAAGLMGVQRPYLIIERPRQAVPEEQQHYTGFPSFITEEMSELEGYTEVEAVHLHDLGCTENEAREIERLLMEGVIF